LSPDISYIVSAYNRPDLLPSCLWSLKAQSESSIEVIVTDNAVDDGIAKEQKRIVEGLKDKRFRYFRTAGKTKINDCYWSGEWGVKKASGKWISFPCDDCYYVPTFSEKMLGAAKLYGWDLVCCDTLYRWNSGQHGVLHVQPERALGTKTCFILKRDCFSGFRMKPQGKAAPCAADATALLDICKSGIKFGVVQQALLVHN
jgi:glycosyltransferase involved in cell wall biosynthesis